MKGEDDILTNPPPRIVRTGGTVKSIIGTKANDPFLVYNPYSKQYEVGILFLAPTGRIHNMLANKDDWLKIIDGVHRMINSIPK